MKNGHSAFLVFLNRDHVSAYKRYHIYMMTRCSKKMYYYFQHADSDAYLFLSLSPCRLCAVVSALKGRGVAEVIVNARQVSSSTPNCYI